MPPRILTKNNKKKMKNFGSLTTHLLNGVHLWSVDVVWSLKSARTIVGDIEREVLEKKLCLGEKNETGRMNKRSRDFSLFLSLSLFPSTNGKHFEREEV